MTLIWPKPQISSDLPLSLAALLPTANHNQEVFAALHATLPQEHEVIVPLFLSDPFLTAGSVARELRAAGVTNVAALPSVQQYGATFLSTLNELGVGAVRERAMLDRLNADGFQTYCTIADATAAVAETSSDHRVIVGYQFPDIATAKQPGLLLQRAAMLAARMPDRVIHILDDTADPPRLNALPPGSAHSA